MLDNIIGKYGLDEVSKKTKISKRNLEKLAKKEFGSFSKPRALGFLSIIERDYGEDLSNIKDEVTKRYENEEENQQAHVAFPPPEDKISKRWIAIVPLIIALVFGFYLYQNEFSYGSKSENKNSLVMKSEQKVFEEQEKPNQDSSQISIKSETIEEKSEENSSFKSSVTKSNDILDVSIIEKDDKNISTEKDDTNSSISPYVPIESIVVFPRVKMWLGIIDLKNKKRISRVISQSFDIDADGSKLITTGHGSFNLSDTLGNNLKFNDPNKHYFLLKDGVTREITKKEFKQLNGGKVW